MKISSGCILKWLCVVGFLMCSCVQETEANSCEMIEVQTCLGAYVKGFTASTAATSDEVGLHCDLDRVSICLLSDYTAGWSITKVI